ncbi:MAG: hypothetical protein P1P64_05450 [Treponemataceae bacterium]
MAKININIEDRIKFKIPFWAINTWTFNLAMKENAKNGAKVPKITGKELKAIKEELKRLADPTGNFDLVTVKQNGKIVINISVLK